MNQMDNKEEEPTESLMDLEISAEQQNDAKGGSGGGGGGAGKATFQDFHFTMKTI